MADPLYDKASQIVIAGRRVSISFLQRHLNIGYNRAARLIEAMERAGLVTPMAVDGTRKLIDPDSGAPKPRIRPFIAIGTAIDQT